MLRNGSLQTRQVAVATLGGQPQIVTLTLDLLLKQGVQLETLYVVHLQLNDPRYRAAHQRIEHEFAIQAYPHIRYQPTLVRQWQSVPVVDLDTREAIDAAHDTFDLLFRDLKQSGYTIHLCITGGRRLLGSLGIMAAQQRFASSDKIWHLYSSNTVRATTRDGAMMHLADHSNTQLLPIPFQPLAALNATTTGRFGTTDEEYERCLQVVQQLSKRETDTLRAFAEGLTPKEVAQRLSIVVKTVDAHKTKIFNHCAIAWNTDKNLNYPWLRNKFAHFFRV